MSSQVFSIDDPNFPISLLSALTIAKVFFYVRLLMCSCESIEERLTPSRIVTPMPSMLAARDNGLS